MSNKTSLVAPFINKIFKDIRPGWKKILLSPEIKPTINKCFKELDNYLANKGVTTKHILKNGLNSYIRPKYQNIFEAFKYFDPNNMIAIIIGQDPYIKLEQAQGLCFSTPKKIKIPNSLEVIYKSLINSGQINIDEIPSDGELIGWARQGILLLNRYLTRSPNIKKDEKGEIWIDGNGNSGQQFLHKFWEEFTNKLIHYITKYFMNKFTYPYFSINHDKHYLAIMLWGKIAQEIKSYIYSDSHQIFDVSQDVCKIDILEWCQLPENNENHFVQCDHFNKVNDSLEKLGFKKIIWNPNYKGDDSLLDQFYYVENPDVNKMITNYNNPEYRMLLYNDASNTKINKIIYKFLREKNVTKTETQNPIVVGVDGACISNGNINAKGSYAAYFPKTFGGKLNGILDDASKSMNLYGIVPTKILKLDSEKWELIETDIFTKITNSRAELLGLIYAFLQVIKRYEKTKIRRPIYIIEDSTYGLHLVNSRIWKYLLKNEDMPNVEANRDLVLIIKSLLFKMSETIPNYEKLDPQNISQKNIQKIWDILIQMNGKLFEKNKCEQDLSWQGLTMIHQNSHLSENKKKTINVIGGTQLESHLCNETADYLCNLALKKNNLGTIIEFTP